LFVTTDYGRNHQSLIVAPWIDGSLGLGTAALSIAAKTDASYTVEVVALLPKIPLVAPVPDSLACADIPPALQRDTHGNLLPLICLNDSETLYLPDLSGGSRPQVIFSLPPGPHIVGVQVYPDRSPPNAPFGDADLYCIAVDELAEDIAGNALFASFADGQDSLTFAINSAQRVWLRCDADVWTDASVAITFSTIAPLISLPIVAIDPYDYATFVAASSSAVVSVNNLNDINYCADWKYVFFF
jgi:hypothetical protein